MTGNVYIKSFPNGLKVFLSGDCDFDSLLSEISLKFTESKKFFKNSKIAVSFEGRNLSLLEEKLLINAMEKGAEFTVLYIIGKDEETNMTFSKVIEKPVLDSSTEKKFGKLYTGSLKKGERLSTDSGIVIMGDVEPGAIVISKGSVVVLGGIYGTVQIDIQNDFEKYFIAASDISCEKLKIGDYRFYSKDKGKWVIKPKMQPKVAYYTNKQVAVEAISKDILSKLARNIG